MTPGFQKSTLLVTTGDGLNFVVAENLDYVASNGTVLRIPIGATTDGASTPRAMWPMIPPFGSYWLAAVLHDAAYRNTLLIGWGDSFILANLPKEQCDILLFEAMESLGVERELITTIFNGVNYCGESSFEKDRKVS